MKKMATVFAMITLICTLPTMAFGQTGKRNRTATPVQPGNVVDADGWPIGHLRGKTGNQHSKVKAPQAKTQGTRRSLQNGTLIEHPDIRKEFDRGYLSPYASNSYTGTTTVNQGRRNNLNVNAGSGND